MGKAKLFPDTAGDCSVSVEAPRAAPQVAEGTSTVSLDSLAVVIGTTLDEVEKQLILRTLAAQDNNKTRTAQVLGISLKTLHNKLKAYGGS